MATSTTVQQKQQTPPGFLTVQFQEIQEPGTYVNQRGEMFRVPQDALADGRSPLITWETQENNTVTRISQEPWLPISKARQLAADADLPVRF